MLMNSYLLSYYSDAGKSPKSFMMNRQVLLPQKGSYKDQKQPSHTNSSSSSSAKKTFVSAITLDIKNGQCQPSSVPSKTPPTSAVEPSTAAAPSKPGYLRRGQGKGPAHTVSGGASGNKALNRLPGKTKPHEGSAACTVPGKKQVQGVCACSYLRLASPVWVTCCIMFDAVHPLAIQ